MMPKNIDTTPAETEAVKSYQDALERLGYPEYNAICSFNGWKIHQTKGKRTP